MDIQTWCPTGEAALIVGKTIFLSFVLSELIMFPFSYISSSRKSNRSEFRFKSLEISSLFRYNVEIIKIILLIKKFNFVQLTIASLSKITLSQNNVDFGLGVV